MDRFDWSSLDIAAVQDRLVARARAHGLGGAAVRFEPIIASTNTALLQAPFVGQPQAPQVLIAADQSAGRGRQGRTWLSQPGRSACLSLAFESSNSTAPGAGLPLAIGVGLALAFASTVPGLALKWPNDLLREGKKCAGILIESRRGTGPSSDVERIVIGVGLNLFAPNDVTPLQATGLFDDIDAPALNWVITTALEAVFDAALQHRAHGLDAFTAQWNRLDAYQGQPVVVSDSGRVVAQGINLGLGAGGALRVQAAHGEVQVITGDVSLRPAAALDQPAMPSGAACAR